MWEVFDRNISSKEYTVIEQDHDDDDDDDIFL